MIYLIYDTASRLTKIGKSNNPKQRFADIRVGNPNAKLVFVSDKYTEIELHEKYNHLRVSGEWFKLAKGEYFEIVGSSANTPKPMFYKNFSIKHNDAPILSVKRDTIILVRVKDGIGIDRKLNGFTLDGTPIKRRCYNGRICYISGSKRIGLSTLRNSAPVKIKIENVCPF